MKEKYINKYTNNNWLSPLFTSIFYNNSSARRYFEAHTLGADQIDYFGNTAQFYESKSSKQ